MDYETITVSLNPQFRAIIERAEAGRKAEGGISHEEILRRFGMDRAQADESEPQKI